MAIKECAKHQPKKSKKQVKDAAFSLPQAWDKEKKSEFAMLTGAEPAMISAD